MHKRIIAIIITLLTINIVANAATLEEAVDKVAKRLFVETLVDKNVLRPYFDWGFIDKRYIDAFAGALHSGLLCPKGSLLRPKSEDLSPLIKGLVRFGISSGTFDVVSFFGKTDITENIETLYIINNEVITGYKPDISKRYYAVVNKDYRAYVVWQETEDRKSVV